MKQKTFSLFIIAAFCAVLLCGCGRKADKEESGIPAVPAITQELPVAEETVPPYDSIGKADPTEVQQVKDSLMNAVEACREIYAAAEKNDTFNVVLPDSTVHEMVCKIGSLGYPAIDSLDRWDMESSATIIEFGQLLNIVDDLSCTYYVVYPDGQICAFHLSRSLGEWNLISMTMRWNKDGSPGTITRGQYRIGNVRYTDKGWLIYDRDFQSFDDNQRSNTSEYVFVRTLPYDSTKRALARKYIEPIGYFENNLFTTTWTQWNFDPIDFNSLYAYLFGMYHGTEMLSSYNIANYYSAVDGTSLFVVPTERFEEVVQYYFDIDSTYLKNISDYNSRAGGYFFVGYTTHYYNVTPRTPEPEVVDYHYNSDGSVTMRVDAVNKWYGTDRAFTHEVTVYEYESGRVKYISNTLIDAPDNIIPENKLCVQLDIERKKTSY